MQLLSLERDHTASRFPHYVIIYHCIISLKLQLKDTMRCLNVYILLKIYQPIKLPYFYLPLLKHHRIFVIQITSTQTFLDFCHTITSTQKSSDLCHTNYLYSNIIGSLSYQLPLLKHHWIFVTHITSSQAPSDLCPTNYLYSNIIRSLSHK